MCLAMAYPVHDIKGVHPLHRTGSTYSGSGYLGVSPVGPNIREITFQTLGFKVHCNQ